MVAKMSSVIEGSLEVNVLEGRVVLTIRQNNKDPVYTAFDPGQALEIADMLAKASYYAKYGKDRPVLASLGDMIIEAKRQKLNNRCKVMLTSMLSDQKSNSYIIQQLVDTCLSEIT